MGAALKFKELRSHVRYNLNKPISGKLFACSDGRELKFLVKDYSVGGLGIVSSDPVLPDVDFILKFDNLEVTLCLVWGLDKNDGSGSHRYGFKVADPACNLELLIQKHIA